VENDKKEKQTPATCAALILVEEKIIRGKKIAAGTALGSMSCGEGFVIEDIDLGIQLGQVRVVPVKSGKK
jgi:hypothetical protein